MNNRTEQSQCEPTFMPSLGLQVSGSKLPLPGFDLGLLGLSNLCTQCLIMKEGQGSVHRTQFSGPGPLPYADLAHSTSFPQLRAAALALCVWSPSSGSCSSAFISVFSASLLDPALFSSPHTRGLGTCLLSPGCQAEAASFLVFKMPKYHTSLQARSL